MKPSKQGMPSMHSMQWDSCQLLVENGGIWALAFLRRAAMSQCTCHNIIKGRYRSSALQLTRRRCGGLLLLAPSIMRSSTKAANVRCG